MDIEELLKRNDYALTNYEGRNLTALPAQKIAILTCMDTRIDPLSLFGFKVGEVVVIRNAGGRVTEDVIRSIILAVNLLEVNHVIVMHHLGCALYNKSDSHVRKEMLDLVVIPEDYRFFAIENPEEALKADIETILACKYLVKIPQVTGLIFDPSTGKITLP
jgi:carbonic anhydrase